MNDFGALVSEFERAGLKHATRSRVRWWLKQRDVSAAFVELFFKRVLQSRAWEPFEGQELPEETRQESAGYREAARSIRTITLRPPIRSLLLTVGFISIFPAWLLFMVEYGRLGDWFAWVQLSLVLPPLLFGVLRLFRFIRPDRIEVQSERANSKRGDLVRSALHRDEVAFVGVAQHSDAVVLSALSTRDRRLGFLLGSYRDNAWTVFVQRLDGTVIILGDHLHEKTARAAALRLEQALELEKRARVQARVETDEEELATQDDESVAASVEDRADSDVKSTGTR